MGLVVGEFEEVYGCSLIRRFFIGEEEMYLFNDGNGPYTLRGIRASLTNKKAHN